jgi:CheY-like chemotaxis protein
MDPPVESSRPSSPNLEGARRDLRKAEGRRQVLLAEDDEGTRRIMAASLRGLGLDVTELDDGGRLLVAIASQYKSERALDRLALVVTDLRMPVFDGLDVIKGLRATRARVPVLVVTAHDTPDVREAVFRLGATFLAKPVDLDFFEQAVRDLLTEQPPRSSRP